MPHVHVFGIAKYLNSCWQPSGGCGVLCDREKEPGSPETRGPYREGETGCCRGDHLYNFC